MGEDDVELWLCRRNGFCSRRLLVKPLRGSARMNRRFIRLMRDRGERQVEPRYSMLVDSRSASILGLFWIEIPTMSLVGTEMISLFSILRSTPPSTTL